MKDFVRTPRGTTVYNDKGEVVMTLPPRPPDPGPKSPPPPPKLHTGMYL